MSEGIYAASVKAGDQSLEARRKAFSERADGSLAIQSWREVVNSTLVGIEGELTALAARRKLSESWVDSFFAPAAEGKKRKAVDPAPAPAE